MTSSAQPRRDDGRSPVDDRDRGEDAVDVVEGEVGSARLKEPTEVEAKPGSDESGTGWMIADGGLGQAGRAPARRRAGLPAVGRDGPSAVMV